MHYC